MGRNQTLQHRFILRSWPQSWISFSRFHTSNGIDRSITSKRSVETWKWRNTSGWRGRVVFGEGLFFQMFKFKYTLRFIAAGYVYYVACLVSVGNNTSTRKSIQENRRAVPFDVRYNSETMDLLTPLGFSNALYHTMCLDAGASATSAPVCSTFVMLHPSWPSSKSHFV